MRRAKLAKKEPSASLLGPHMLWLYAAAGMKTVLVGALVVTSVNQLLAGFPNVKSLMHFFAPARTSYVMPTASRADGSDVSYACPGFLMVKSLGRYARSRPKRKPGRVGVGLRWLSVQFLFEFIHQFLIVGLDAKISVPSYWTVFSVF